MFRAIMAVAVGYLVMAILVLCASAGGFVALGADGAFDGSTYEPSKAMIVISIVAAVVAAFAGGLIAGRIATTRTPIKVLIGIVVVMGVLHAGYQMQRGTFAERPAGQTLREAAEGAAEHGRTPPWLALAHTAIGGIGLRVGAAKRFRG